MDIFSVILCVSSNIYFRAFIRNVCLIYPMIFATGGELILVENVLLTHVYIVSIAF